MITQIQNKNLEQLNLRLDAVMPLCSKSEVIYKQNGMSCTAAIAYWKLDDLELEEFFPVKAYDKSTGEFKCEVYVNVRTIN